MFRPVFGTSLNNIQARALREPFQILAGVEGVEPANAGIKIRCLNQLGDTPTRDDCLMILLQVIYKQPTHNHLSTTNLQEDGSANYCICELQSHQDGLK